MNLSSATCFRVRPRSRTRPCVKKSSTRTRDEDEVAWLVHGPDARPILEVAIPMSTKACSKRENTLQKAGRYLILLGKLSHCSRRRLGLFEVGISLSGITTAALSEQ